MKCDTCGAKLIHGSKSPSDWSHEGGHCINYLKQQFIITDEFYKAACKSRDDLNKDVQKMMTEFLRYKKEYEELKSFTKTLADYCENVEAVLIKLRSLSDHD